MSGAVLLVGGRRMGGALARGGSERMFLFAPHVAVMPDTTKVDLSGPSTLPTPLTLIVAITPHVLPRVFAELKPLADAGCLIVSMRLARATFVGAAALAEARTDPLEALRVEVTSPVGMTAAALGEFDRGGALDALMDAACVAGAARSRELAS